ncbi:Adenylate cyclase 1 [Aquicella siphonis]|uniref:Adenylate cyclase 1 n=1 Tax=Aquicella siphonis TaxID=254247 RepID=A0A5E4PHA0_9COXI|nr:adenylate/guanylate cyclase domain-containing protein [Aquicella siphonis]VVC75822.1 Adenylate cyclase 1 [Aquicella siphonis]
MKYIKVLINFINHIIVTLKFSILSLFITLFLTASLILMTLSYKSSSDDIFFIANKSMEDITHSLSQMFLSEVRLAQRDSGITLSLITGKVLDVDEPDEMIRYFYYLAEFFNIVQAIYWGDTKGNYVSAEYEDDDSITSHYIDRSIPAPTESIIRRNVAGTVISSTQSHDVDYDPRVRPWFLSAQKIGKAAWTNVYLYKPSDYLGITLATPVYGKKGLLEGVLGVDLRLDWISWYIDGLKITPHGILFVVMENGKLIAYPNFDKLPKMSRLLDIHELPSKWIAYSFDKYKKLKAKRFSFRYQGVTYLATYQSVPEFKDQGWLIGLVIPENDFIGTLNKARITNMLISLFILLLGVFLVSRFVNSIVKPVKQLILETNKIKNFDLADDQPVHTRVKEIILLSDAIQTMKTGLRAFKRYVPSDLVKQLIRKGENAKLGGSRKTIVAFFSDIKDFTTITHQSRPDGLMAQLNEYFEAFTNIIIQEKGTIDKYIGDSIMAFWGAPDDIDRPCHHAASAALEFQETLSSLNHKWEEEGRSPFYTRIGIHIGDAIVGNVGSSERINYTAIGDSINIASRLEGINKEYNTNILVSEAVYQIIQDEFVLKEMGYASLKGIKEKVLVYALLARRTPSRID